MIEFQHTVAESEVNSFYLNLKDDHGRRYGTQLPPDGTEITIIDAKDRPTLAKKHGANQLWGRLRDWYRQNGVQAGTIVLVKYDPGERHQGRPVVRLLSDVVPQLETVAAPTNLVGADDRNHATEIPLALERQLEDFLAGNLDLVEKGLKLLRDEDSHLGKQYPTDVGTMDLLCQRPDNSFLVIELKRDKSSDKVVGQISRYMGWVRHHLAQGRPVHGLILTHDRDEGLKYAVMAHENISLRYFRLRLDLVAEDDLSTS